MHTSAIQNAPDGSRRVPRRRLASCRPCLITAVVGLTAGIFVVGGCSSPLAVQSERELRRSVLDSVRREMVQAREFPAVQTTQQEPGLSRLELKPDLMPIYERMAGPQSYDKNASPMGDNLLGQPQTTMPITLESAIRSAVERNIQVQFARLQPAIAESQVTAAQAAFDTTLFNNFDWSNLDQPRTQTRQGTQLFGTGFDQREVMTNSTGLRQPLISGGQFSLQQDLTSTDVNTTGQSTSPNPANEVDWTLRLDQPLLRGFGSEVTLAQVRLTRNAERDSVAVLKRDLIRTITDTEQAYWQLVQARLNLLILQRLYERGVDVRDQVITRGETIRDVTAAQVADARARVERRRADVIRGQLAVRAASDSLKALINDPNAPVGDEALVVPVDDPLAAPISFSLVDVLTNAIRNRPEVRQAILSIDNTSIRMQVADNARLPRLDLRAQARLAGLRDNFGDAYTDLAEGQFVDYLVGIQFEQAIGNRAAESAYRQRRIERMQATLAYRNTIQQVILEVKRTLRQVVTNYTLIDVTRTSRYAESENLRAFQVEKAVLRGFTVEQLDLEFRRQEALAAAEQAEVAALTDYNIAIAQLYAAMGTALEHNNIDFRIPDAEESSEHGGLSTPTNPVTPVDKKTPVIVPPSPRYTPVWRTAPR